MTPGQLAYWLIRAGLFRAIVPKRLTIEWSEEELDWLQDNYGLLGPATVAAHLWRSINSVKQMATRLDLAADMREYMPLPQVAKLAGVSVPAVHQWIRAHHGYRKHLRTWGGNLTLMPAPMVRQYLTARRKTSRPPGWWGSARSADHLQCSIPTLHTLPLTRAQVGQTLYYEPHGVKQMAEHRNHHPPQHYVRLRDVTGPGGPSARAHQWLTAQGYPVQTLRHPGTRQQARYTSADAARAFLSARGHRAEQIDTLLRKAMLMQASKIKEEQ